MVNRSFILLAFILLALPYAFATPIFEKSDEVMHFAFVRHLANGGGLPVQSMASREAPWAQEGSQPPLYYAAAAAVVRLFNTRDFDLQRLPNATPLYDPYAPGNKNVLIITPEKRPFAYRDSTLAAMVLRLLGILIGSITVWLTFGLAYTLTRDSRLAAVAMALTAFNPMFLNVNTAVSNDGPLIALATAALYVLARAVALGVTLRRAALFGTLVGLASLTKISGALLLPLAGAMLIAPRQASPSALPLARLKLIVAVISPWLLIAAWWYARNLALYGDLTGTTMMAAIAHPRSISLLEALAEFQGLRLSYLAVFGHFNVPADGVVYQAFDIFLLMCLVGLVLYVARRRHSAGITHWIGLGAVAAHALLTYAALVRWTMMTPASQGRLLFPAIAGLSTLMAVGLFELARVRADIGQRTIAPLARLPAVACGAFCALALISPFRYIAPAYEPPWVAELPGDMLPARQRLGPFAEVIGYSMRPDVVYPGDRVRVSVIMRARRATPGNYSLVVSLLGRDNQQLARFETFTGGGLIPSSGWRSGEMWRDTVDLVVPKDAIAPTTLRVQFALYNRGSGDIATSYDEHGKPGSPLFEGATLLPSARHYEQASAPLANLGDVASLLAVQYAPTAVAGRPLTVTLIWLSRGATPKPHTTFLHLVDEHGVLRAQQDAPPLNGQFPTTRWHFGVIFDDPYTLQLPTDLRPGHYHLFAGLYDAVELIRMPAFDPDGKRLPDGRIYLGEVRITKPAD